MRKGNQPPITTVTENMVMRNVVKYSKQLVSVVIATAHANSHNIIKLTETLDHYKGKMAEMKKVLRKEERVGMESKRKYEATLSDYEKLQ